MLQTSTNAFRLRNHANQIKSPRRLRLAPCQMTFNGCKTIVITTVMMMMIMMIMMMMMRMRMTMTMKMKMKMMMMMMVVVVVVMVVVVVVVVVVFVVMGCSWCYAWLLAVVKLVDGTFYMMNCWFSYILILFRTAMLRSSWDGKAMRRPICNSRSKMKTRTLGPTTPLSCIWKVEWCRSATTAVQRMAFMEFWPQHIGMSIFILQIQSLFWFRWQV